MRKLLMILCLATFATSVTAVAVTPAFASRSGHDHRGHDAGDDHGHHAGHDHDHGGMRGGHR
jgi:Ni/Co efflux regulator RcnB